MWQTGDGAKQSTRRGGPSLTEDSQTQRERLPREKVEVAEVHLKQLAVYYVVGM